MPVTSWEVVAGHACCECGGPATHVYGDVYWCCECHGGELFTREQAEKEHKRVISEREQR